MEDILKLILSLMLMIASIFMAQSAFAATPMIQEALNPPDIQGLFSVVAAPVGLTESEANFRFTVTPSANVSGHHLINSHRTGLYTAYVTAGLGNEFQEVETLLKSPSLNSIANRDKVQGIDLINFREVETVLKFPYLIHPEININEEILEVGLVA